MVSGSVAATVDRQVDAGHAANLRSVQQVVQGLDGMAAMITGRLAMVRNLLVRLENARLNAELSLRRLETPGALGGWFGWHIDDPSLSLFQDLVKEGAVVLSPRSLVLDVGCCESDWLAVALQADPTLQAVGVDWRPSEGPGGLRLRADVRDAKLFQPNTFDWIVALSSIEHVGLGHYDGDPVDPDGDRVAMANLWTWLKPGGRLYVDVPYRPEGFVVRDDSYRAYDAGALDQRLLPGFVREAAWYTASPTSAERITEPIKTPEGHDFVNVAILAHREN